MAPDLDAEGVQVDVWSDIVCPWCAIGRARIRKAAAESGIRLRLVHHAFELRPDEPGGRTAVDMLAERYGGRERALEMTRRVRELAALDGLVLRTDEAPSTNTFDAHRLVAWAQGQGKGDELVERITAAHFTDLQDVADPLVLRQAAEAVGLDGEQAARVLASLAHADEVRADEAHVRQLGISGVPFFVLDGRLGVSGAQSVHVFRAALAQASSAQAPFEAAIVGGFSTEMPDVHPNRRKSGPLWHT
jgi:predicted DsbA family dithiol-disulfide isomerase